MMKKYLMTAIAAVAMGAAFTSCSHNDDLYNNGEENQQQKKEQQKQIVLSEYNAVFVMAFGQPSANQDWGFGSVAGTRGAAPNSNEWFDGKTAKFKHLVKPQDVTAREEEVVSGWFQENKNPTCDPIELNEFFVQQVYFGTTEYHSTDNNGHATSVIGGQHMDWLYAWDPVKNEKDHINNFNTNSPQRTATGLSNMQLMQNSSTEIFGFHESYNTQNQRYYGVKNVNWVIKAIEVDGVWGYYVGFDYESHGDRGDYEPDGFFDDRIVKIVPGNGFYPWIPTKAVRVIAEDLSADSSTDFDFNDIVMDVTLKTGGADIVLRAAGGTLPLRINGDDSKEVHKLFKVDTDVMVNTGVTGAKGAKKDPVEFSITGSFSNAKDIKIEVNKGTEENPNWIELPAVKGEPAAKIGVRPTYKWCDEKVSIKGQYEKFVPWVTAQDPKDVYWY